MKIKHIFFCAAIVLLSACKQNLLDTDPYGTKFQESLVWSSRNNADAFVNKTYSDVLNQYAGFAATDNWTSNGVHTWSVESVPGETYTREDDFGFNRFGIIRRCNLIIEKAGASQLSELDKSELIAEGKFLRAMIYFWQARRFGRVVWIDRVLTAEEETYKLSQTANVAETYSKIIKDLDDAIAGLPETALSGKASKYVAAAIKSEVCLQAAAYTGDNNYYQQAVVAADFVITRGPFTLDQNFGSMFNEEGRFSKEIILGLYRDKANTNCADIDDIQKCVPNIKNDMVVVNNASPRFKASFDIFNAWLAYVPSQTLVDNFLVTDEQTGKALPWNQTSQFLSNMVQNGDRIWKVKDGVNMVVNDIIYKNVDKRLDATVVRDSSTWFGEDIATRAGGNLNRHIVNKAYYWGSSSTNYYWRKGIYNVSPSVLNDRPTDYHYVIMRLGRVYLNKAEALLRQNKVAEAVQALNMTRVTHGGLAPSTASTLADAWTDYKRERRVEFAKEGDFYWSLLRWGKYGGEANHGRVAGGIVYELQDEIPEYLEISRDHKSVTVRTYADSGENYNKIELRVFTPDRRYFFPVQKSQLDRNENLVQSPGW